MEYCLKIGHNHFSSLSSLSFTIVLPFIQSFITYAVETVLLSNTRINEMWILTFRKRPETSERTW